MKILKKLEKRKETWFLLLIVFIFFLLRLPSLIEPLWYGDEGIYQVIGMALNNERLLYSQIWDNKPPLLYVIYALAGSDQFIVRFISLIFGVLSIIGFYLLTVKLFHSAKAIVISVSTFLFLFATPFLEGNIANAENFMLLPIIISALMILKVSESKNDTTKNYMFLSGILLGIAFLLKIVALFDFLAFILFLLLFIFPEKYSSKEFINFLNKIPSMTKFYVIGFIIPILITTSYFLFNGIWFEFIDAVFFGNLNYVAHANSFLILHGFLILKIILLIFGVTLIFWKRKQFSRTAVFIFIWFLFSLFNAFFSGRIWTHYLLVLMPSTVLLIGLLFEREAKKIKIISAILLFFVIYISAFYFKLSLNSFTHVFNYYQNYVLFISGNKNISRYQDFFDQNVSRDYEIAQFISGKTKPGDNIFVWGNNPQIYVLANKLPPGKYTVKYHITQNPEVIAQTAKDLEKAKPKYIILLSDYPDFPFPISKYDINFNIKGVNIYEKTY